MLFIAFLIHILCKNLLKPKAQKQQITKVKLRSISISSVENVLEILKQNLNFWPNIFSSFMRAHAQAMNEYCGGEMSTEVVVDGNLWTEVVDRRRN